MLATLAAEISRRHTVQPEHLATAMRKMALEDEYAQFSPTPAAVVKRGLDVCLDAIPKLPEPEYHMPDDEVAEARDRLRRWLNQQTPERRKAYLAAMQEVKDAPPALKHTALMKVVAAWSRRAEGPEPPEKALNGVDAARVPAQAASARISAS